MSADTDDTDRPVPDPQAPVPPVSVNTPAPPAYPAHGPHPHTSATGSVASHALDAFPDLNGVVGRGGFTFALPHALGVPALPHMPFNPHAADELHRRRGH
jgi:hypothetical protein